ncbi:unnamed protein product [Rotaria sp. Silwood2]|nr:unnamed protein product [Rotaria sp. Silwood2]
MVTNRITTSQKSNNYGSFPFPTRRNDFTDDYEILPDVLGRGVNGRVYKCQHLRTGQKCALKILQDSMRTRREVILHKKACENCQYIVKVLDVYVRIFMEGGELFNRIEKRNDNSYTERDAARYIWMVAQAVYHLHAMDIACDIWSMGVIMYILLCGYPPFFPKLGEYSSSSMRNRIKTGDYQFPDVEWKNISQEARSTIQRMLTVNPANRITIGEILTCSWLTELTSERSIDMSSLQDTAIREQIEAAVAYATDEQRQIDDDDLDFELSGPGLSLIAKRAAKRKQQIDLTDETLRTIINETEHDHDENLATVPIELKC